MLDDPDAKADPRAQILADRAEARAERRVRERTVGPKGAAVTIAFAGALLLLAVAIAYLDAHDVVSGAGKDWVFSFVILTAYGAGTAAIVRWQRRARRAEAQTTPVDAREPPREHLPGPDELEDEARRARLARFAEQRTTWASYTRASAARFTELFWGAMFGGPVVLAQAVLWAEAISRNEPLPPDELAAGLALALATCAGFGVLFAFRRRRLRRAALRRAAFHALATSLGDAELADGERVLAWLDAHWPASSAYQDVYSTPEQQALAARVAGYPVLVDVEPRGLSDEETTLPPRGLVYVAALVPASFAESAHAARLREDLRREGFALECHRGAGLLARASAEAVRPLTSVPPELDEAGEVARRLVAAARAAGVAPAPGGRSPVVRAR